MSEQETITRGEFVNLTGRSKTQLDRLEAAGALIKAGGRGAKTKYTVDSVRLYLSGELEAAARTRKAGGGGGGGDIDIAKVLKEKAAANTQVLKLIEQAGLLITRESANADMAAATTELLSLTNRMPNSVAQHFPPGKRAEVAAEVREILATWRADAAKRGKAAANRQTAARDAWLDLLERLRSGELVVDIPNFEDEGDA